MRLDPLEVAGLLLILGDERVEELPYIAADALVRGLDSPLLREAAGVAPTDWWEARDKFLKALAELDLLPPEDDEQAALWQLVRHTAQLIVDGDTTPNEGAHRIWTWWHRIDAEGDLRIFVGLASEVDDHPDLEDALGQRIRREAAALLARETPRTWIRMKAETGCDWPLWQPKPPRVLRPEELPMPERLRQSIGRWQAEFERNALPPVSYCISVFTNETEATAFVDEGRRLSESLQTELGSSWHVEYYPEPTKPHKGFRRAG